MRLRSLDRCIDVIELLSRHPQGLRLKEIGQALEASPSTVHHILSTLGHRGYVAQEDDTRRYGLGLRFLQISRRILDSLDIRSAARPRMEALHQRCKEAVHLALLRDGKTVYIDVIRRLGGMSMMTEIGHAVDPHASSCGKVLLAGMSPSGVRGLYRRRPLVRFSARTITDINVLLRELKRIREQGYALDDQEYHDGGRCIAAPIVSQGHVVAAISVSGNVFSITHERIRSELRDEVTAAAREISIALSG